MNMQKLMAYAIVLVLLSGGLLACAQGFHLKTNTELESPPGPTHEKLLIARGY